MSTEIKIAIIGGIFTCVSSLIALAGLVMQLRRQIKTDGRKILTDASGQAFEGYDRLIDQLQEQSIKDRERMRELEHDNERLRQMVYTTAKQVEDLELERISDKRRIRELESEVEDLKSYIPKDPH